VNTTQAGCATLTAVIEGPSKVNITCAETEEGYEFSYTPTAPGDYYVLIKYANVTIAGCPSKAVVTG
jgi:filamin